MAIKVELDHKGIDEILKSEGVKAAVHDLAEKIASEVRATDDSLDVVVDDYTTDRAAASVTIRDQRGRLLQVRDGILTRAASAVGLEVKERR